MTPTTCVTRGIEALLDIRNVSTQSSTGVHVYNAHYIKGGLKYPEENLS